MVPPNADQSGLKAHESSGECEEGTGKSYEVSLLVMGPIPQWWAVVDSRIPAFLANAEKALAVPSRLESPSPSCNILQHLATSCNILQHLAIQGDPQSISSIYALDPAMNWRCQESSQVILGS